MFKKSCFTAGLVAVAMMAAAPLFAAPINPLNTRPVPINDPSPAAGEPGLGSLVDQIFLRPAGTTNTTTEQSAAGMWGLSGFPPSSIPTLAFEYSAGKDSQVFGIWFGTDTTDILRYDIFTGAAEGVTGPLGPAGYSAAGLTIAGNTLFVTPGGPGGVCAATVNCTAPGGFTDSRVNAGAFGFYLRAGGNTWYTVDQLNGGVAQSLAFRNGLTNDWAIAFEDARLAGSDSDYNDAVVKVESITAVPEPGSMMLLGTGLLGLARAARRRMARA